MILLKEKLVSWFEQLQKQFCALLEAFEPQARFRNQEWTHQTGNGGGRSCVLQGDFFEKAGVNFSCIESVCSAAVARQLNLEEACAGSPFWVAGVSIIVHPTSPNVPTIHFNTRCFILGQGERLWFGGGIDLTPMLKRRRDPEDADARFFHEALQRVCHAYYAPEVYELYKKQCDDYFFLHHRGEKRGIGGIFYDHVFTNLETDVAFTQALGNCLLETYRTLVTRNQNTPWTEDDRKEQLQWRARYAEFNLLYDRGTRFGLEAGGCVDAIFSSMPPVACW